MKVASPKAAYGIRYSAPFVSLTQQCFRLKSDDVRYPALGSAGIVGLSLNLCVRM